MAVRPLPGGSLGMMLLAEAALAWCDLVAVLEGL